ncbi:MAG TPA: hypothetical protein PL166_09255 [Candidatus Contendobacter sp.]|nr:hypothetical protein [Candidatus Contendobacter sp.]
MNLTTIQNAIVATLTPLLAPLRVQAHGGPFTERELALLLGQAPCVLIAPQNLRRFVPEEPQRWRGEIQWAAVCIGADSGGNRAEQAADAALAVMDQLILQTWGLPDDHVRWVNLDSVAADNLYSGHVNTLRVALWVVTWTQPFFRTVSLEP